jgi:CRP/FNR family transcriptional regulator, anaerobic regulatory protein
MTFTNVHAKIVEDFFAQGELINVKKDDTIIDDTQNPAYIFYLKQGSVAASVFSPEGEQVIIHIFQSGSFFPLAASLSTEYTNRYWYVALSECILYKKTKHEVTHFMHTEPDLCYAMLDNTFKAIDKLTLRIEQLITHSAKARLKSILSYLAKHFGVQKGDIIIIETPFTHNTLASLVGVSRETLTRELNHLEKDGIITQTKKGTFALSKKNLDDFSL